MALSVFNKYISSNLENDSHLKLQILQICAAIMYYSDDNITKLRKFCHIEENIELSILNFPPNFMNKHHLKTRNLIVICFPLLSTRLHLERNKNNNLIQYSILSLNKESVTTNISFFRVSQQSIIVFCILRLENMSTIFFFDNLDYVS